MKIRPEAVSDYADIAALHTRAFGNRAYEPLIVALHRQRRAFDAELSLVAEADGRIAGHALFSPQRVRLLGEAVWAVNLAPIAVDPEYQNAGIGGALIMRGHDVARSKGYAFSFLLGHTDYYPRFGYQMNAFGASSIEVAPPPDAPALPSRPLTADDVPRLRELWEREEGNVDFAIYPGDDLLDWLSPNPAIQACVYLRGEAVVGYARIHSRWPHSPRLFLAADTEAARGMVASFAGESPTLTLLLHPRSASVTAFEGEAKADAWGAAMACSLLPGILDDYFAQLRAGAIPPGRPIWPVAFDLE
jgi:predicted N-acetyltransferase YhbS